MFFSHFEQILEHAEEVQFNIKKTKNGLMIMVLPRINFEGKENEQNNTLRSALSTPLIINASASELDSGFINTLSQYTQSFEQANDALTLLQEANKEAVKEVVKSQNKPLKTEPEKTNNKAPVKDEPATATEPLSLSTSAEVSTKLF